jgi:hypothetical protein
VEIGTRLLPRPGEQPPGDAEAMSAWPAPDREVQRVTLPGCSEEGASWSPGPGGATEERGSAARTVPSRGHPWDPGDRASRRPDRGVRGVAPPENTDGTLLAIVPIPGTGTSLAIVGYPVDNGTLTRPAGNDGQAGKDGARAPADGLLLDHDQRRVWTDGQEIPLTYQEFELLAFLSAHPATVFSRADLVNRVWQRDFAADSRTVDVHVSRLRHKLGHKYGRYLVTEYRVGYQFRPAM